MYYDSDLADPREVSMALQVAVAASKRVPSFSFFKCDTAASSNSDQAEESMLRGGVFIFSRTPHDGIGERVPRTPGDSTEARLRVAASSMA